MNVASGAEGGEVDGVIRVAAGEVLDVGDGEGVGGNVFKRCRLNVEDCNRVEARQGIGCRA